MSMQRSGLHAESCLAATSGAHSMSSAGASMALPPKSTSMYVGKIAPGVDDPTIQALLEACGPIKSWNRLVVGP